MIRTLETRRLRLRGFAPGDVERFAQFYGSDAARFVGGPEDKAATWRRVSSYAGSWFLRGYGKFAVEEKTSGETVGIVGPWFPEGWPEPEIAWTILPAFQHQGYGEEASVCALAFAYGELGWTTAISAILPGNDASSRLAGRLGARREGAATVEPFGALDIHRHLPPAEFRNRFGSLQ